MSYWTSCASTDDIDVVIWFKPEDRKETLRALRAAVDKIKDTPDFFSLDLYVQPDKVTSIYALLDIDDPEFEITSEWEKEDVRVALPDDEHAIAVDGSILKGDVGHFWFVVWDKAGVEFQSDYFAWADLPEGILESV